MKKYICILLCFVLLSAYIPYASAAGEDNIKIYMATEKTGNIFFGGEGCAFTFRFINSSYVDYDITATFSAEGSRGNVPWSKTEQFTLKNLDYVISELNIDLDEKLPYDVYKMKVELKDEAKGIYCTESFDFSYARNNEGIPKNAGFGINTHYSTYDKSPDVIEKTMPLIDKMGASIIRGTVTWSQFEKTPGEYTDITEFPFISEARKYNLDILMGLAYGNDGYGLPDKSMPVTDAQRSAFAAYAAELAAKLKGVTNYFELWNEPNIEGFNQNGATAADYAKLAQAVYPALEGGNEDAVLIGMATSSSAATWMQEVHDAGGTAYMDNISFHPYRWFGYPGDYDFIERLKRIDDFLANNTLNKKMWLTELGWSSGIYDGQSAPYADEYQKAMYLVHSYVMSRQFPNIEKYFWYNFICKGTDAENFDNNFGLIAHTDDVVPYAARPGYLSATNMNIMLADTEFVGLKEQNSGTYIYEFKRNSDGAEVYVLWTTNESGTDSVALDINKTSVVCYDMYGNSTRCEVENGRFEASVTLEPMYIEAKSTEAAGYEYADDIVEIRGTIPSAQTGGIVSMLVLNPGKSPSDVFSQQEEAVAFMNETQIDANGDYSFVFAPQSIVPGIYHAYIMYENSDECIIVPLNLAGKLKSEITVTINGTEAKKASDFIAGGDMKVSYGLENLSDENVNTRIIAAFYKNGALMSATSKNVETYTGQTLTGELQSVVCDSDFDRVSIYVWDADTLKPYMNYLLF